MKKLSFKHTAAACYVGYLVQAILVNFAPLLFVTFQETYALGYARVSLLIVANFAIELIIDLTSAFFVPKLGYRLTVSLAHVFSAAGLIALPFLPDLFPDPMVGLCLAIALCGIGGGLLEVMVGPIIEACPGDHKAGSMAFLHSCYCWGQALTVLLASAFFAAFGIAHWRILSCLFAIVPLADLVLFLFVPINVLPGDGENERGGKLFSGPFFILLLMMLCAGASELSVAQWASDFAERGLGVSKTVGDLLGPCAFAVLMGISRIVYGRLSVKVPIRRALAVSAAGCLISYALIVFSPYPVLSLIGCALCGAAVGAMWPGTISLAAEALPDGGVKMFSFLALAGDLGCLSGPSLVGTVGDATADLKFGFAAAAVFPALLLICTLIGKKEKPSHPI